MVQGIRGLLLGLIVLGAGTPVAAQSSQGQDTRRLVDVISSYAVFDHAGRTEVIPIDALSVVRGKIVLPPRAARMTTRWRGRRHSATIVTRSGIDEHLAIVALLTTLDGSSSAGPSNTRGPRTKRYGQAFQTEWYDKHGAKQIVLTIQEYGESMEAALKRHKAALKAMRKAFP